MKSQAGQQTATLEDRYEAAFVALHNLSLDVEGTLTPHRLAHWAQRAIHAVLSQTATAVWWLGPDHAEVIAGHPPSALATLPVVVPNHLCLVDKGTLFNSAFFGHPEINSWRFVPITDRTSLYGWIGLELIGELFPRGYLPFLCTVGAILGRAIQKQRLEEERVQAGRREALLSRYLSPAMARAIAANLDLNRCVAGVSVLYLDLRGFTARVYSQSHWELLQEMNGFFERVVEVVFQNSGVVDKLLGDGLLAEFGILKEEPPNPAGRAVRAASQIIEVTQRFNRDQQPRVPFKVNIGIATGEVHVGHVGGAGFFDLTVLGVPVNLAARLEHEASLLDVDVVIDVATFNALDSSNEWSCFPGRVVRGCPDPITVWGKHFLVPRAFAATRK